VRDKLPPRAARGFKRLECGTTLLDNARMHSPSPDLERTRLLDFARASGDWMWETDAQLRYTWVSGAFEAITGLPPLSMIGRQIADSPLLDELAQPLPGGRSFHQLLQEHRPITRVLTDKQTGRGVLRISRSAVPVFDAQGQFAGYRGTARDVSAHVEAERKAHVQAELLRKLSSQVPGVIFQFQLHPDGQVSYPYASDASRELFGVEPPRDGNGGDPTVPFRLLHPDDQRGYLDSIEASARTLTAWQRSYRIVRDDGSVRWMETRAMPERLADGSTLWHGFTADITAQKQAEIALRGSEERWSMAAEAAGIGVAQFSLASGEVAFDRRACTNHGQPWPLPHYMLDDFLAAVHPGDRAATEAAIQRALATDGRLETRYRLLRPDGQPAMLELFARCTHDTAGRVDGLVGTCRDITQQAALEQLRRDKEAAEQANRAKSEFLSRVSHELRTPLNGILGFAQLMSLDRLHPLAPDQRRRIDSVMHAGRHLLELINDVLNLARIEQEDFSLKPVPVDLCAAVESCLAIIQPLADNAGIRLLAPQPTGCWATADARAVEQVLLNLLSNAIKYNRAGGTVRLVLQHDGERVTVAVSDEGEGLTTAQQTQLFQPFNRLGAEQRRIEGSGLGLVIARTLSAAMQGELLLRSTPGQGSTFTLVLPACDVVRADPASALPAATPPAAPAVAQKHVLYVEDEPLNVMLMQEVFKGRPQWRLSVANDGASGLAAAREQAPDLLLIDMNLPDTSGLTLIRRLRDDARTSGLRCIALSADAMQPQIDAALAAGFDDYWTKPINVARVLDAVAKAMEKPTAP
jgi:PAS domain S-box-containing protein